MMGLLSDAFALVLLGALIAIYCAKTWSNRPRALPLPPGPKGYPFVGNVGEIPKEQPWVKYREWSIEYGSDVVYAELFGQGMAILNSAKATKSLLEKRSAIYSDRPAMPMLDLMGWEWDFAHMPYGDSWRRHRRVFHQFFNSNAIIDHRPVQVAQTRTLIQKLARSPESFMTHIRYHGGSIILLLTYGYEMQSETADHYMDLVSRATEGIIAAGNPGTYLVDFLPILKYVPSWFPGAAFQGIAAKSVPHVRTFRDSPFDAVKTGMANGDTVPCFVSVNLEKLAKLGMFPDGEEVIRNAAAAAYGGGSDTTVSVVKWFILAMILNPEVQKRAQEELDAVVGNSRLPVFEDRPNLPYLDCVVRETVRWAPIAPLAVAHRVMQEDHYEGYRIPKGATVVANVWAVLNDEDEYQDPKSFRPERFMKADERNTEKDPYDAVFGFGRRVCPGRHLAEGTMWIAIASILSVFNLSKAIGSDGKEIDIAVQYVPGVVCHPCPFPCTIQPRSRLVQELQ